MRILHVVPTYLPATRYGGPIYSIHGLARAQAALGHQVSVITTSADGEQDSAVAHGVPVPLDGVNVYYFRSARLRRLYYAPAMRACLRDMLARIDFVHLHSVFLWPTNRAARECVRAKVPYALAPRGMLVPALVRQRSAWLKRSWLRLVESYTLRHAAFFHATSALEIDDARALGVRVQAPQVIPNGIDLTPLLEPLAMAPYALFLGRINWKKRIDWLLDALSDVPELRLVIAGPDEEALLPILQAQIQTLGLSTRVTIHAEVGGASKLALLNNARVLVLPSISENFGNVVLEAFNQRCPVIVSAGVGLATSVFKSQAGWVFTGRTELLAALTEASLNPLDARARGVRGRELVEEQFAWPQVAAQMVDAYQAARAR